VIRVANQVKVGRKAVNQKSYLELSTPTKIVHIVQQYALCRAFFCSLSTSDPINAVTLGLFLFFISYLIAITMPPKAARGRQPRGGGRGRGRGKVAPEPEPSNPAIKSEDSESQLTAEQLSSESAVPSVPLAATEQNQSNDESTVPSPNSSPATVPTETPAPTPVRAPPPRTESSSSIAPPASQGRDRGGLNAGVGQRGKPATESKFKPRAIRRDAGERERIKKEEMEKQASLEKEAEAEAARIARGLTRGRGRGGRGRGDRLDRSQTNRNVNSASGLFGIAPEEMGKS
jgi:DNA-directed RNA polymerase III subunit RPC4